MPSGPRRIVFRQTSLRSLRYLFRSSSEQAGAYARERTSGPDLRDWPGRREWVIRLFRQPVVRSGDVARPLAGPPQLAPLPLAELIAAQASPSPEKDAFSIGDSTGNKRPGFDVASFREAQSNDPGTRAEWNQ